MLCEDKDRPQGPELADIFRIYGQAYRERYALSLPMLKAMQAIESCRTAALGGHVEECDECGHIRISYNSCRNRHCPKCGGLAKEKWLAERKRDLLPVSYYHVVFTIPADLNRLALVNQQAVYNILFRAASETLLELGKDPRHLGAEIGFIAVLHTWGQNLMDHPHLHCIVPGGGIQRNTGHWISSRKGFFIPVRVLSRLFRGKFLDYLKRAYYAGELKFEGKISHFTRPKVFHNLLDGLYLKEWITYCKRSFAGPQDVLAYLGNYTHKVAISNHRIMGLENGKVTFRWRDYRDRNQNKLMCLEVFEFIRRFFLHILPPGFVRIRYYGIMSNRNRNKKLKQCKEILIVFPTEDLEKRSMDWKEVLLELTGFDLSRCPQCRKGHMVVKEILPPTGHSPPQIISSAA